MNNNVVEISASLSCIDLLHLQDSIEEINETPISFLHYDVVDGEFNSCFIFGDIILSKIRPLTNKKIEVHLACNDAEKYLKPFVDAGADYIAIHYEIDADVKSILKKIKDLGAKPILAFKADSEVPENFAELAKEVNWILKLMVNPGFAGQKMQSNAIAHVACMSEIIRENKLATKIQVDGNIHKDTIPAVIKAGATILTGGTSGLFKKDNTLLSCYQEMMEATNL